MAHALSGSREPCTPQFPATRQDLQQQFGHLIANARQGHSQLKGPPVTAAKSVPPSKHAPESLDGVAAQCSPNLPTAEVAVPEAPDCAAARLAAQTLPKSTRCAPVDTTDFRSSMGEAIVKRDTSRPHPEQWGAACASPALPPVDLSRIACNMNEDTASMPNAGDAAHHMTDPVSQTASAVVVRTDEATAQPSDPDAGVSGAVPPACDAVETDARMATQGAEAAHSLGSEAVDEPSAAVQQVLQEAIPVAREPADAACALDRDIPEGTAQPLVHKDNVIEAASRVGDITATVPDASHQTKNGLETPYHAQVESSKHHLLQQAVKSHADNHKGPSHHADAVSDRLEPVSNSGAPESSEFASKGVERRTQQNATDISPPVTVTGRTSDAFFSSKAAGHCAALDEAQNAENAGTWTCSVPNTVVAPLCAEQFVEATAQADAQSGRGQPTCMQGVREKKPVHADSVCMHQKRPNADPYAPTKYVHTCKDAAGVSVRDELESGTLLGGPAAPHQATHVTPLSELAQHQQDASTVPPSTDSSAVLTATANPVCGGVEVLCRESASHTRESDRQEGMVATDDKNAIERQCHKAVVEPEHFPPASAQTVNINVAISGLKHSKNTSDRARHVPPHVLTTKRASIQKVAKQKPCRAHSSAVAKAAAQQELVSAAAAQRAERGVLGGCGEILSRGPLQPPWCLYWSDETSNGLVTSKLLSDCNEQQAVQCQKSGTSHLQPILSPGPSYALKARIQELSLPANTCPKPSESPCQVHGTLGGNSYVQHSAGGDANTLNVEGSMPDVERAACCHVAHETTDFVKRPHEELEITHCSEPQLAGQGMHRSQMHIQRRFNDACVQELASVLKSSTHTNRLCGESSDVFANSVGLAAIMRRLPESVSSVDDEPRQRVHDEPDNSAALVAARSESHELFASKRIPRAVVESAAAHGGTADHLPVGTAHSNGALRHVVTDTQGTACSRGNAEEQQNRENAFGRDLSTALRTMSPQSHKRPRAEPSSCCADLKALLTKEIAERHFLSESSPPPGPGSDPGFQTNRTVVEQACQSSEDMRPAVLLNLLEPAVSSDKQGVQTLARVQGLQSVLAEAPAGIMLHSEVGQRTLAEASSPKGCDLAEVISRTTVAGNGHAQIASSPEEAGAGASALAAQLRAHQHHYSPDSDRTQVLHSIRKQSGNQDASGSVRVHGTADGDTVQPCFPSDNKGTFLPAHCQQNEETVKVDAMLGVLRGTVHESVDIGKADPSSGAHENPEQHPYGSCTGTISASGAGYVVAAVSPPNGIISTQLNALRDLLNNTSSKVLADPAQGSTSPIEERLMSSTASPLSPGCARLTHKKTPGPTAGGTHKLVHRSDVAPSPPDQSPEQSPAVHHTFSALGASLGDKAQHQQRVRERQHASRCTQQIRLAHHDQEALSPGAFRVDAHDHAGPAASCKQRSGECQPSLNLPLVATEGNCDAAIPDFQLSPTATDDEQADTPRFGLTIEQTCIDLCPATQTPTDVPVCSKKLNPTRSPTLERPDSLMHSTRTLKRLRGEVDVDKNTLTPPSAAHPGDSKDDAQQVLKAAASPDTEVATPKPPSVLPSQSLSATQPVNLSSTEGPGQSNVTPLATDDAGRASSPQHTGLHTSHGPTQCAPTPAMTPVIQTRPVSRCDAAQGCSDGSRAVVSGDGSGGRGRSWTPGSVLGGLMGRLGSMSLKRLKTSPVVDSLPVVAPPRLLEGINWRLEAEFSTVLKGRLHDVVLRCPTVTLVIPRCTAAWRSCVQHSMVPPHASPDLHSQSTMGDLGTQHLEMQQLEADIATQVENPEAATPTPAQVVSICLTPSASVTPALREVTNTQDSALRSENPSQQSAPDLSQSSVGRVVGFTQAPTPVAQPNDQERAGKVSVVLESERRAFTVVDVLQAVRGALQDVKGSESWVFDGLHKISAAGKQPVVYETVFML